MTRRETQYINWRNFWIKIKRLPPNIPKYDEKTKTYSVIITHRRVRVPDNLLIKMGRK